MYRQWIFHGEIQETLLPYKSEMFKNVHYNIIVLFCVYIIVYDN